MMRDVYYVTLHFTPSNRTQRQRGQLSSCARLEMLQQQRVAGAVALHT